MTGTSATNIGGTRHLSDADSLMWRMEADPVLRSPIVVIGLLDRVPKPKQLRATVERACETLPGLRHRLVFSGGVFTGGPWRAHWEEDDRFCLDHHLRWVGAVSGGLRDVLDLAEPDAAAPFDPHRPMWSLTVVEGLRGGRAAFVLRFHHAITDGVGGLEFAAGVLDSTRRPAESAHVSTPAPKPTLSAMSPSDRLAVRADALLTAAGAATGAAVGAVRDPRATVAGSMRMARSLGRLLAPVPSGSPLLQGRGLDRRLHVVELPLEGLHKAAAAAGGTINDALLAAVGGAFRAYHQHHRVTVPTMSVTMPINRRRSDEAVGGNRFTPARFVLPVDDSDPVKRLKIAGAIVRSWREAPALGATDVVAAGLNLLPGPVVTRVFGGLLRSIDADVTDLAGLTQKAFVGGARIDRMWAFAPPTGAAFSVTLLSHLDTCCVALACDRTPIAQSELLANCLQASLDEILALAGEDDVSEVPS